MNTESDGDIIPSPDLYNKLRRKKREEKIRKEEEKERLEEESKRKKIDGCVDNLSRELAKQLRKGVEYPTVTLPHRHSNLIEPIVAGLKRIFEEKGYRCHFNTDPCTSDQEWTDEGWITVFNSNPHKDPYFQLG